MKDIRTGITPADPLPTVFGISAILGAAYYKIALPTGQDVTSMLGLIIYGGALMTFLTSVISLVAALPKHRMSPVHKLNLIWGLVSMSFLLLFVYRLNNMF